MTRGVFRNALRLSAHHSPHLLETNGRARAGETTGPAELCVIARSEATKQSIANMSGQSRAPKN